MPVEASKKGMEKGRRSGESHSRKPWLARTTPEKRRKRKSKNTNFFVRGKLPAVRGQKDIRKRKQRAFWRELPVFCGADPNKSVYASGERPHHHHYYYYYYSDLCGSALVRLPVTTLAVVIGCGD
jgi:hypothetical protein